MNYYPNTWRGALGGARPPEARGPHRRGAQCNRIGCIGFKAGPVAKTNFQLFLQAVLL